MTDSTKHEEDLDFMMLQFGKFKGLTPEKIAKLPPRDAQYLVWAYENVGNSDVCSTALYKELGGKGSRAAVDKSKRDYRTWKPEEQAGNFPDNKTYDISDWEEVPPKNTGTDNPDDDDIPF